MAMHQPQQPLNGSAKLPQPLHQRLRLAVQQVPAETRLAEEVDHFQLY